MYLVLPLPDMHNSARALTPAHLRQNIIAARWALLVNLGIEHGEDLDSSVRVGAALFRHHSLWLAEYGKVMVELGRDKGETDLAYFFDEFDGLAQSVVDDFENEATAPPSWFGTELFHSRNRAYLIGLDRQYRDIHDWLETPAILPVGFSMLQGFR